MSDDEEKRKAESEAAKKWVEDTQKMLDDELVARWRHFEDLAYRMLVGDPQSTQPVQYDPREVRHLAEMLLLLDIARGSTNRFRARYAGNY